LQPLEGCDINSILLRLRIHLALRILMWGDHVSFRSKWIRTSFAELRSGSWKFCRSKGRIDEMGFIDLNMTK